jgi:hypothetical protein
MNLGVFYTLRLDEEGVKGVLDNIELKKKK